MSTINQHRFIIGGVPQSGKSSLAKKVSETSLKRQFSLWTQSYHRCTRHFPQLDITHFTSNPRIVCEKLSTFYPSIGTTYKI